MNYESFSDVEICEVLNNDFIPIKVDIQERPDISILYNKVCKSICGYGGSPLTILMTPEEKIFFAGTYLPKNTHYSMLGLLDLLKGVNNIWKNEREKIILNSRNISYYLDKYYKGEGISNSYCSNALEIEYEKLAIDEKKNKNVLTILFNCIFNRSKNNKAYEVEDKNLLELEKLIYKNSFLISSYLESYNIGEGNLFKKQDLNYIEDTLRNNILDYKNKIEKEMHTKESILSWVGLMIAALGKAYNIMDDKKYIKCANRAVDLIYNKLINSKSKNERVLDDYAFTILGLIELYDGSYNVEYLKKAITLSSKMIKLFWDEVEGGFFLFTNRKNSIKELNEESRPSGNVIAAYVLFKLAKLTDDFHLEKYAKREIEFISKNRKEGDMKYSFYSIAACFAIHNGKKLVCLLKDKKEINEVKVALKRKGDFDLTTIVVTKENKREIENIAKFLKNYAIVNDKSTYYLCDDKKCKSPVNNIKEILA